MSYNYIEFSNNKGRANITLNRPDGNYLNTEMLEEIVDALDILRDDELIKALVIKGANGTFCRGVDHESLQADQIGLLMPHYTRMYDYMNEIKGLVIAGVDGEALGAGCELIAFCDVVIASHSSSFGFPEVSMGLFPPIAAAVLPRLLGRSRALDWIISSDKFSADKAYQNHLVTRVVLDEKLSEAVDKYADKIASYSAPAVTLAKRAVDMALYSSVMDALHITESTYMLDLMNSIDPHEGIKAVMENRDPVWRNK